MMRVVVFGLGHVGIVTAAGLLRDGHAVIGVDSNDHIRDHVGRGLSPFHEPGVAALVAAGHADGRLTVALSAGDAIDADLAFVCVGTRGLADGTLDLADVKVVARQLGEAIRLRSHQRPPMLLVFRSTLLPGSMNATVLPTLVAAAGETPGARYEVAYYPTFTREGSALADHFAPARIVIGERRPQSARVLLDLLGGGEGPIFTTSFEVAELTKIADNAFHALKVGFANEIGRFALHSGISRDEVFDVFHADTQLNLSAAYLRPGGAFGGPCLPKDVRAFAARMNEIGIDAPIIAHVFDSNSSHMNFLVAEIERRTAPRSRILLLGLSFKNGTDDVRESPFVRLAESLLDRGHHLSIYDPDIARDGASVPASLPPRLSAHVLSRLPAADAWDLVVVGKEAPEVTQSLGAGASVFRIDRL